MKSSWSTEYSLSMAYDKPIEPWQQKRRMIEVCYATWYIRTGGVSVQEGDESYSATAGQCMLLSPCWNRSQQFEPHTHLLSIRFVRYAQHPATLETYVPPRVYEKAPLIPLLKQAEALVMIHSEDDPSPWHSCKRLARFYDFLSYWHRLNPVVNAPESDAQCDPRVKLAIEYLQDNPGLGPVDYGSLKTATGLSKPQIDRLFRQQCRCSPRQWIEYHSLLQAKKSLRDSSASIKEIAYRLRFFDASHFSKWFRRHVGASPSQYRLNP